MHPARTRIAQLGITGAAIALAVGTAAPAWADPGNGNGSGGGNGNAPSAPPGQVKQTEPPVAPTASGAPASAPTSTQVAPGQAKKTPTPPKGMGTTHAPGQVKKGAGGNTNGNGAGKGNGVGKGNGANGPDGHNPPGNNGTVKIHAIPGDPGHHNVPHPGCSFAVDFWGFDAGQTLTVSFTGQAPTGAGTPLSLSGSGTSVTSPDDAGGGNDPDGELVFTPTASELSVLGAPAHQGYHVRLTVATGQGGGMKQKVFWISPCAPAAPVPSTPVQGAPVPAPVDTPTLSVDTPTLSVDTPTVRTLTDSMTAVRSAPVFSIPELDSARVTRTSPKLSQASRPLGSLPFTGANLSTLITSGILALLIGTATMMAVRRRHNVG
jgi:hypothetical protein